MESARKIVNAACSAVAFIIFMIFAGYLGFKSFANSDFTSSLTQLGACIALFRTAKYFFDYFREWLREVLEAYEEDNY
jgi:hypothetical protein